MVHLNIFMNKTLTLLSADSRSIYVLAINVPISDAYTGFFKEE